MTGMNKLALAAAATAALGAAATPAAFAGRNVQGPQLTGIALGSLEAGQPAIIAVSLPSGGDGAFPDGVDLRGPGRDGIALNGAHPDGADPTRGLDLVVAGGGSKPDTNGNPK